MPLDDEVKQGDETTGEITLVDHQEEEEDQEDKENTVLQVFILLMIAPLAFWVLLNYFSSVLKGLSYLMTSLMPMVNHQLFFKKNVN